MTSALRRVLVALVILAPHGAEAEQAPQQNLISGWPTLLYGSPSSGSYTLLGSHLDIEVSFFMSNDVSSPDSVTLSAGFFRHMELSLIDETSGQVVAAVSQWREIGSCPGQLDCSIDTDIFLGPGSGATFIAVLSTVDGQPLAEGQYLLRVMSGAARQRIRMPNGSPWSGRIGAEGRIPVAVRPIRDEADLRSFDNIRALAAARRNDYTEALAIYQGMIARDPNDAGAHGFAARALTRLGRLPEAAAAYERMLNLEPLAAQAAPEIIAAVYFAIEEDAKALALLRRHVSPDRLQAAEREARQGAVALRITR
jgi:hypothetical protein